jgi:hypothetical protein
MNTGKYILLKLYSWCPMGWSDFSIDDWVLGESTKEHGEIYIYITQHCTYL